MEEFHDSLDEGNDRTECVVTLDRHTDLALTNQLINSLGNQSQQQSQYYHQSQIENNNVLMSEPSGSNTLMERTENDSFQNDFTRRSSLNARQQSVNVGSPVYKRSGPDGSPAFNHSSGFLPQPSDNESVIFMPVRQLNFSALDDTTKTDDNFMHQEEQRQPDLPYVNGRENNPFISEHREEVYGSQDADEESRENSPAAGFFELKSSPLQSSESGEELDSRVVFSPVRGLGDQSQMAADEKDLSRTEFQKYLMASHLSQGQQNREIEDEDDAYQEPNLASPNRNKMLNSSGISLPSSEFGYHENKQSFIQNYVSPTSRENPSYSAHSPRHNTVKTEVSEKREVFVAIPQAVSDNSNIVFGANRGNPGTGNIIAEENLCNQPHSDNYGSHQNLAENNKMSPHAAWEISVNDEIKQNKGQAKDTRVMGKSVNDRKPFVSSVKSDVSSYHPKESQLPRPKTKGADAKQGPLEQRSSRNDLNQGQKMINRGQRSVNENHQFDRERRSGPIPSHTENRMISRKNITNTDRQSKPGIKQEDHRKGLESVRNKPLVQDTQNKSMGGRNTESANKHQELSPVHPATNVITQVQHYGLNREDKGKDASLDVKGMEDVRSQLQNMLKYSANAFADQRDIELSNQVLSMDVPVDPVQLPMDYSMLSGGNPDEVTDLLENFPSFTSHMWTDSSATGNRSDVSLHAENQRLREVLEKERYRRKHCEQYIQRLNVKLLETQQQVAVAVSTDKRKDIMIEQLDKQLAKVVEGWKKRDEDKEQLLQHLKNEKIKIEEKQVKQNEMIQNFEKDMSDALEQLRKEKNDASIEIDQLKRQLSENERAKNHAEEMLEAEKERIQLINQEWETMKETREHLEKKIQQLQDRSRNEQDEWFKREQELLQRIEEVGDNNKKIVQQEREKCEESLKLNKEMEEKLYSTQTEVRRLEMEIDAAVREKESLKVEMSIMEAKFEGSQRTLEAELHSQMEKEIAEQITDVHKRMEESENEMRENHHKQIKELNQRHTKDIEKSMSKFHDDLKNREEEFRKLTLEYEQKLQEQRSEISTLQQTKQKLESQRSEILMKLQYMMQSQWNEAVQLLASTPQRKNLASVSFSSQTTSASNNTNTTTQTTFPVTSSPARNSTISSIHQPPPIDTDLSDFTTSLHMQQLLQSLSQPMMFTQSSQRTATETKLPNFTMQDSTNTENMACSSRNGQSTKINVVPEEKTDLDDPETERLNSHVHSWLQSSVGPRLQPDVSGYREQVKSSSEIQSSNLGQTSQFFTSHNLPQQFSSAFIPNLENDILPPSYSVTAVPIRPPQRSHGNVVDHGETYPHNTQEQVNNISFESIKSANQLSVDQLRKQHKHPQSQNSPENLQNTSSRIVPGAGRSQGPHSHEGVRNEMKYPPNNPSHSPPTKQSRRKENEERQRADSGGTPGGSIHEESLRLNAEYHDIAERFEQHESKQGELQHYIQMLLQKPPGELTDHEHITEDNTSQYSQDQTEDLGLNDTAQAAQIQQELNRIQQLRDKHTKIQGNQATEKNQKSFPSAHSAVNQENPSAVLQPDQLAEITKMLNQYQEHFDGGQNISKDEEEHMVHLVNILQNIQFKGQAEHASKEVKRGVVHSPGSPKNKDVNKIKRNLKDQLGVSVDAGQPRGDKSGMKPPLKKPERKIASSSKAQQGKSKSAWK